MSANTRISTSAGAISGILIRSAICHCVGAVDAGRLVERRVDALQRRVEDDHVVAGPLPGDDVEQAVEDQVAC